MKYNFLLIALFLLLTIFTSMYPVNGDRSKSKHKVNNTSISHKPSETYLSHATKTKRSNHTETRLIKHNVRSSIQKSSPVKKRDARAAKSKVSTAKKQPKIRSKAPKNGQKRLSTWNWD